MPPASFIGAYTFECGHDFGARRLAAAFHSGLASGGSFLYAADYHYAGTWLATNIYRRRQVLIFIFMPCRRAHRHMPDNYNYATPRRFIFTPAGRGAYGKFRHHSQCRKIYVGLSADVEIRLPAGHQADAQRYHWSGPIISPRGLSGAERWPFALAAWRRASLTASSRARGGGEGRRARVRH